METVNKQEDQSMMTYVVRFAITILLALLIGLGYFYKDSILSFFDAAESDDMSAMQMEPAGGSTPTKREIKYWRAPMDPTYIRDEPGKSPMGMDLVPVYEDEGDGGNFVKIDPNVVQNIGVRTTKVKLADISRSIRTVGLVTYDESKLAKIQSKVKGWVEKLYINETGRKVKNGTILLEIYSPDLVSTQEEYLLALKYRDALKEGTRESIAKSGETLLKSARRRLELFDVPEHQIVELEKSRDVKKTLHIHSSANGVIVKKNIVEGMYVQPGDTLYEIADLTKVWVNADVYENEIPHVKIGQRAKLRMASFPGRTFTGKIAYIYPFMDSKSRSVKVRLEFDNSDGELKPDMYGDVTLFAEMKEKVIAAPTESVIRTGSRSILFVDKGEGRFEPRDVTIGFESEGMLEIRSGVEPGESVVTSAQFLIDSESKLREVINKMSDQPSDNTGQMDHSGMDHGQMEMDHSNMDHSQMEMDHSNMDHGQMEMDHGNMDHSGH